MATALLGFAGCAAAEFAPTPHQVALRPMATKLEQEDSVGFYAATVERQESTQSPASTRRVSYEPPVVQRFDENGRLWDVTRRHFAELRGRRGQQALFVDGRRVWPRSGATTFHGTPVWSPDGHGLAVVEEVARATRLVVMVEYRDPSGDLTWPIPRDAVAPTLKLFWANHSKVVIGETLMRPRFAANWQRLN